MHNSWEAGPRSAAELMEAATHFESAAGRLRRCTLLRWGKPTSLAMRPVVPPPGSGILEEKRRREPVKYCIGDAL